MQHFEKIQYNSLFFPIGFKNDEKIMYINKKLKKYFYTNINIYIINKVEYLVSCSIPSIEV